MKIDPQIKLRHLREAAVEQVCRNYERQDYSIEKATDPGLDVIARRQDEVVAIQVKVLGLADGSAIKNAAARARQLGASFKLFIASLDGELQVGVEGLEATLLQTTQRAASSWPGEYGLDEAWSAHAIGDVVIERISVHPGQVKVEGTAAATFRLNTEMLQLLQRLMQEAEDLTLLVRFHLLLGGEGQVLDGSTVEPVDD